MFHVGAGRGSGYGHLAVLVEQIGQSLGQGLGRQIIADLHQITFGKRARTRQIYGPEQQLSVFFQDHVVHAVGLGRQVRTCTALQ